MVSAHILVLAIIGAVVLALFVGALLSIVKTASSPTRTAVWIAVALVFPLAGPLVWFVAGRSWERARSSGTAGTA